MINMDWLLEDVYFMKVSESCTFVIYDCIKEFIDNYISEHNRKEYLICRLSDMHILFAAKSSENLLRDDERTFKDILSSEQCEHIERNRFYIIGFMIMSDYTTKDTHFIEYIDTRLRGYRLAEHMMNKYYEYNKKHCLPYEILYSSEKYWSNIMNCYSMEDVNEIYTEYNIDKDKVYWKPLLEMIESENVDNDVSSTSSDDIEIYSSLI